MDILEEHYYEYISHIYEKSCKIVKKDTRQQIGYPLLIIGCKTYV